MEKNSIIDYNTLNVNMQTILFFLEVAKHGNMTVVANNLHVTQPFLSQRISALENILNFQLFQRKYHRMQLTEEGKILYKAWSEIIDIYRRSIDEARASSDERKNRISFGLWDNIILPAQVDIANTLASLAPDVRLDIRIFNRVNARALLFERHTDLILLTDYGNSMDAPDLCTLLVCELELYANMNGKNPLSSRRELSLSDLKDEVWLCTETDQPATYRPFLTQQCEKTGYRPRFLMLEDTSQQKFKLLFNEAISVCPAIGIDSTFDGIVSLRIRDLKVPVIFAWRRDGRPEIARFAQLAAEPLREALARYNAASFPAG